MEPQINKCYMCDEPGNTKEHVPPSSFFPTGYREGIVTVPSCPAHNNDNSPDVEYVRNVITSHYATNEVARGHFAGKVMRSFIHSPGLFIRTFTGARPYELEGEETGIVPLNLDRFNNVMEAIAHALHYMDYGITFRGKWAVYSPSLVNSSLPVHGQPDTINETMREALSSNSYVDKQTSQPLVFKYGVAEDGQGNRIYRFQFYEGFVVNALGRAEASGERPVIAAEYSGPLCQDSERSIFKV